MGVYDSFSILIVLTAFFAYINHRFIKLPTTIGLMAMAILSSLLIIILGKIFPETLATAHKYINSFDFSDLLLGSMLSFMLFAGAIHIKLDLLKQERLSVMIFSTMSVIISTFMVGFLIFYLLQWFHLNVSLIHCLLFGALISPTDPIAVLGILKDAKITKSLEMKIAGESLFNDGVGVVVFTTILHIAQQSSDFHISDAIFHFIKDAGGGLFLGLITGYIGYKMMVSIDNYIVEVLITLAVVMGTYSFANYLHISGPLAMVSAGILVGNQIKEAEKSDITAEYTDKFWELVDDLSNALLFILMGFSLLLIQFSTTYIVVGFITILIVLMTRYISLLLPAQLVKLKEEITNRMIIILTWGGLRGGLSIAMALSLKPEMQRDLWVTLTYFVVAFSILIQGLTVGKLARRLK